MEKRRIIFETCRKKIDKICTNKKYNAIFCCGTSFAANISAEVPIVCFADACWEALMGYYPEYEKISKYSKRRGNEIEKKILNKSFHIFYTSEWAKEIACNYYGILSDKTSVVRFGANVSHLCSKEYIDDLISNRMKSKTIKILFVGTNWLRKGGEEALEAVKIINQQGVNAIMEIIGCSPRIKDEDRKYVNLYGYLNKNNLEDMKLINKLYENSNLFIFTTFQDCAAASLIETVSYGLPVIARNTGGVASVVFDKKSGYLLHEDAKPNEFANAAIKLLKDHSLYYKMSKSAFQIYEEELTWDKVGSKMDKIIRSIL